MFFFASRFQKSLMLDSRAVVAKKILRRGPNWRQRSKIFLAEDPMWPINCDFPNQEAKRKQKKNGPFHIFLTGDPILLTVISLVNKSTWRVISILPADPSNFQTFFPARSDFAEWHKFLRGDNSIIMIKIKIIVIWFLVLINYYWITILFISWCD